MAAVNFVTTQILNRFVIDKLDNGVEPSALAEQLFEIFDLPQIKVEALKASKSLTSKIQDLHADYKKILNSSKAIYYKPIFELKYKLPYSNN